MYQWVEGRGGERERGEGGREKGRGGLNCKNIHLQSYLSHSGGGRGEGDREGGRGRGVGEGGQE